MIQSKLKKTVSVILSVLIVAGALCTTLTCAGAADSVVLDIIAANTGEKVSRYFESAGKTDLSAVEAPEIDGNVFLGYYADRECTEPLTEYELKDGTNTIYAKMESVGRLSAQQGDITKTTAETSGFDLYGAQIREETESWSTGLRFCTRISKALLSKIESETGFPAQCGYALCKKDSVPADGNLKVGMNTVEGNAVKEFPTVKVLYEADEYIVITACITGISSECMTVNVAARPYLKYKDESGTQRFYYFSEQEQVKNCGGGYFTSYDAVKNAAHTHSYTVTSVAPPTKSQLAMATYTCSCGDEYTAQYLSANDKTRHVVCTELSDRAKDYYTGTYSYSSLSALSGVDSADSYTATQNNPLYDALHTLMSDTHTHECTYSGYESNSLAAYWKQTDAENGSDTYLYFYADILQSDSSVSSKTLNREHVWPQSLASYYQQGGGADLHHLRPAISGVNQSKSNRSFAEFEDGTTYKVNGEDVIWKSTVNGLSVLKVRDNIKGDIARILLYVYCRWQQPNLYSDVATENLPALDSDDDQDLGTRIIENRETLLSWCQSDPVDEWEMERNDQIENIQGNRNVFIDYPELAWLMFGQSVPQNMQTPSGANK